MKRSIAKRLLMVGGLAGLVSSCGGEGADPNGPSSIAPLFSNGSPGTPTKIAIFSGNAQPGAVNRPLLQPLVVLVTDSSNAPVPGAIVSFTVTAGGGSVATPSAITDAAGNASTMWTLGPTAASSRVNATVAGLPTVQFYASPRIPGIIKIYNNNGQNGAAGQPLIQPLNVQVLQTDGFTRVPGVEVTFTATTGGGSMVSPTVITNATGIAGGILILGPAAGLNEVQVTVPGLTSLTLSATALIPTKVSIWAGNNQQGTSGLPLANPLIIRVVDVNGKSVPGAPASFSLTGGGGTLGSAASTTDVNGRASVMLTLGPNPGPNTVAGRSGALTAVNFTATGVGSPATAIAIVSGNNQSGPVGSALTSPFVVLVTDGGGSPVNGATVTFAVTGGGGSLGTGSAVTGPNGQASVTLTLGAAVGPNTITATTGALTPVTFSATGNPLPPALVAIVSGNDQSGIVGSGLPNPFVVLVTDANGAPVTGATVDFAVTGGDGTLGAASATTGTDGKASAVLTLGATPGSNTVTATVGALPPVTFTATGLPAGPAAIAIVSGNGQSGFAGSVLPNPFVVVVTDAINAPLMGATVDFEVTGGDGTLSTASATTGADGRASVTLTLGVTAGSNVVTAKAGALTPISFTATGLVAGPAAIAIVSGNNQSTTVGSTLSSPFVVLVTDGLDAPLSGATVTFAVTGGGGTLSAASSLTGANGQASITLTLGPGEGPNTVTATAGGLTPVTFTAQGTPAGPAAIAIVSGNNQSATELSVLGNPFVVLVTDAGNAPVNGATVNFTVTGGGGSLSTSTATTGPNGQASTTLTLGSAGPNTVTATVGSLTPVTFTATAIPAGPAALVIISGNNQAGPVSSVLANQLLVQVNNAGGSGVAGASVGFAVTGGGGTLSATNVITDVGGRASVTLTLGPVAGLNTVTVTVAGVTPVSFTATGTSTSAGFALAQITSGWNHTCAITPAGKAYCWGNNSYAQIGYGGYVSPQLKPLPVAGGITFQSVYAAGFGWFNCGVSTTGAGYCWGSNGHGQLGIGSGGTGQLRTTPTAMTGGLIFRVIRPGGDFACGLTISGVAYCWGANASGQLGDGTTVERFSPVPVQGGLVFEDISPGGNHACGVIASGQTYCWGANVSGQLGDGTASTRLTPVPVLGAVAMRSVSAGGAATCGLTLAGAAYCWGANSSGQVGDGSFTLRRSPVPVAGGRTFQALDGRGNTACGVTTDGATYCWGENSAGESGNGGQTDSNVPVAVTGGLTFSAVTVGGAGACGLTPGGDAWCWGPNGYGQVGDGTKTIRLAPTAVRF